MTKGQEQKEAEKTMTQADISKGVYGKRITEPILGNYFKFPERTTGRHDFQLDTSFAYVSIPCKIPVWSTKKE